MGGKISYYFAGSIYDAKLLQRTSSSNLSVWGCRIYLESYAFLIAVERCNEDQLVEILPKLPKELVIGILCIQSLKEFMDTCCNERLSTNNGIRSVFDKNKCALMQDLVLKCNVHMCIEQVMGISEQQPYLN